MTLLKEKMTSSNECRIITVCIWNDDGAEIQYGCNVASYSQRAHRPTAYELRQGHSNLDNALREGFRALNWQALA